MIGASAAWCAGPLAALQAAGSLGSPWNPGHWPGGRSPGLGLPARWAGCKRRVSQVLLVELGGTPPRSDRRAFAAVRLGRECRIDAKNIEMALRPAIHRSVPAATVAAREFRPFVRPELLIHPFYTVISYPGRRGESPSVVMSRSIGRALEKIAGEQAPIVAIAHNFTAEALELLEAQRAVVVRQGDFYWSDRSYEEIAPKK